MAGRFYVMWRKRGSRRWHLLPIKSSASCATALRKAKKAKTALGTVAVFQGGKSKPIKKCPRR